MATVNEKMTAIADEIRTLSGTTEAIGLDAMATHIGEANDEVDSQVELLAQAVAALKGKASGGGESTPTQEKIVNIKENGIVEVTPDEGYALSKVTANVSVSVPSPTLQEKSVTPTKSAQSVVADSGFDGLSKVNVEAIPNEYIVPNGEIIISKNGQYDIAEYSTAMVQVPIPDDYIKPSGTKEITENGAYDVTQYASVEVDVSSEAPNIQPLEITENGTYTAPDGVDGYSPITVKVASSGGGEVADEGTNARWFADLITDSARTVEVYNDKFAGTLSAYAFYERANVTKIELPNLEYLKERCFFGCQNLKTLLLPGLIGYTYQYMAAGCAALVDVDIHGTNYVSSYTFQNCTSLKKVDLHRVGTIATNAFYGATKLDTLIIRTDTVPTLGGINAFTNTKIKSGDTGYIYVKSALLASFASATNWSTFASQFRAIEDYPEICGG